MCNHTKLTTIYPKFGELFLWLPLLISLYSGNGWGDVCTFADHDVEWNNCDLQIECSYAIEYNSANPAAMTASGAIDAKTLALFPSNSLTFDFERTEGSCAMNGKGNGCSTSAKNCFGIEFDDGDTLTFDGTATLSVPAEDTLGKQGCFNVKATTSIVSLPPGIPASCGRDYRIHISSSGGGWGDPHIKTVDNVNYDFQAAGEFTLVRGEGLEIQTRQSPVSTSHVPAPNGYTDIASCVSIYTAVAARVGDHRVTIQPNLSGEPDPSGVQIRVDGKLRTLGPNGIDLSSCNCSTDEIKSGGRIVRSADEQSIEVHYPDDTKLVVTPAWSNNMKKWYMNINVYDTTATEGVMGRVVDRWLPALSDGTSVGPKATNDEERYKQLNEIFADSWRVTDDTSLFDYAEDTSTDTFTLQSWPRNNPDSCLLEGEPVMVPVDEAVAKEWCSIVVDEDNRENCIFDVRETGIFGFADAYARSERIVPGDTRTILVQDRNSDEQFSAVMFTATVQRSVSTIGKINSGVVQFLLDGENAGEPTEFDINRNAVWRASQLSRGVHTLEARFLPSGFGERFRPSSSKVEFKY